MASKMSLSKDLIDVKARNNHRVSVLKPYLFVLFCLLIGLHYKFKVCLYLFIQNWVFEGGAYQRVRLIRGLLRYSSPQGSFPGKRNRILCFTKTQEIFGL